MQRLVTAAPSLQRFHSSQPQTAALLTPLTILTALQELELSRVDDAGAGVVAKLTGLRRLHLWGPSSVTEAGLLGLTALQQLTHLMLYSLGLAGWKDTLIFDGRVSAQTLLLE